MELIIGFAIGAVIVGMVGTFLWERQEWNGGICRDTGTPWGRYGTSSQGCRGYRSEDYYLWVTYPLVGRDTTPKGDNPDG